MTRTTKTTTTRKTSTKATAAKTPTPKPVTMKAVNEAIRALGGEEKLVRGAGYFYFIEGKAHTWFGSMVCVYRLADLSLEQWIESYRELAGVPETPKPSSWRMFADAVSNLAA